MTPTWTWEWYKPIWIRNSTLDSMLITFYFIYLFLLQKITLFLHLLFKLVCMSVCFHFWRIYVMARFSHIKVVFFFHLTFLHSRGYATQTNIYWNKNILIWRLEEMMLKNSMRFVNIKFLAISRNFVAFLHPLHFLHIDMQSYNFTTWNPYTFTK